MFVVEINGYLASVADEPLIERSEKTALLKAVALNPDYPLDCFTVRELTIPDLLKLWEKVEGLKRYLSLDKFKGTENGERKDWVAVSDVFDRL